MSTKPKLDKLRDGDLRDRTDSSALRKGIDTLDVRHAELAETLSALRKDIAKAAADVSYLATTFPGFKRKALQ